MRRLFFSRSVVLGLIALMSASALFAFQSAGPSSQAGASGSFTSVDRVSVSGTGEQFGPTSGGTYSGGSNGTVIIHGAGFRDNAFGPANQVMFGPEAATNFSVLNDSEIEAVPPAHGVAEGVPVNVFAPFSFFTTICFLPLVPLPCSNAYYYMNETDLNVSVPVGVLIPETTVSVGSGSSIVSLSAKLEELQAPIVVNGHLRLSENLGIPTAFDVDASVTIPKLQLTLAVTGQGTYDVDLPPYLILVPGVLTLRFHAEVSLSASVQLQPTLTGLNGHLNASFANGAFNFGGGAQCNGQNISLSNIGDCAYITPTVTGQASVKVDPFWLQVGEKNVFGTGFNAHFAVSAVRFGLAGGVDSSLPGGLFGEACASLLYWEWEFKLPNAFGPGTNFQLGQHGDIFGPWNLAHLPAGASGAASECPIDGTLIGSSGNGPGGGGWGTDTPPPPPPPGSGPAIDTTPPVIHVTVSPASNAAGWNNSSVDIHWSVSDPESGIASTTGCVDETISFETYGLVRGCSATNGAGQGTSLSTRVIKIDRTSPALTGSQNPPQNPRAWNNGDVTVHFDCNDVGPVESGIGSCTGDQVISGEGRNQSRSGTAVDFADNSANATVGGINIDKTAPNTTASLSPPTPNGKRGWYISNVTVTLNASDPLLSNGDAGSGIQYTNYRVNGGPWQAYNVTGPFVVSTESLDDKVEYYSVDNADNVEATHAVDFHLDKTPPNVSITSGGLDGLLWDQAHLQHGILTNTSTLALTGTATDNLCLWEVRTVDVDSGLTTSSQQPPNANVFPPPPPNSLGYSLSVPLHIGINTIDVTAEDCAGWMKAIRIQIVYVIPGPVDPRNSTGFWDNGVQSRKFTTADITKFLSYANVASDVWGNDPSRNRYGPLTLANYQSILQPSSSDPEKKMKSALLGDWLNMVSGRLAVKTHVDVSQVKSWQVIMDEIGGNPSTFAYKVTLEVEDLIQPAPTTPLIYGTSEDLTKALDVGRLILP